VTSPNTTASSPRSSPGRSGVSALRLLPPFDPLLAGRDRALLVPDTARRRVLWPALGHPGAVLADGEVVGTWRPQASGKTLTLTVTPFEDGPWPGLEEEAERVAAARGLRLADVAWTTVS
jgi:hypothetical protein